MKEVEKAKKEAAKFKHKRDKEKEKEKEKIDKIDEETSPEESNMTFPERLSTPYSYKPPPPYTLHSAPSVSQLVYQPPSLERFNSVKNSSKAVTSLALSLEPARPASTYGMPTPPPTSPPDKESKATYGRYADHAQQTQSTSSQPQWGFSEQSSASTQKTEPSTTSDNEENKKPPEYPGKRVFSDPGPGQSKVTAGEHLSPGGALRERSRSPCGFSSVPQDSVPKVDRKRPFFAQTQSSPESNTFDNRTFSTPAPSSGRMGSVPEEPLPASAGPYTTTSPASEPSKPWSIWPGPPPPELPKPPPTNEERKPSFKYQPPPPPLPPSYFETVSAHTQPNDTPPLPPRPSKTTSEAPPRKPSIPPPPPPQHGTTYIVITPYLTHEIGHLSLVPFDTLVDVIVYTPEEESLPYPTAFDVEPKHYWQASLGNRRGPRGLFPVDSVRPIDSEMVTQKLGECWFAEKEVGFICDVVGRCWVGPDWEWTEPARRRNKWWAEEF